MKTLSYYFLSLDIETSTLFTKDKSGKNIPSSVWLSYGFCNLYDTDGYRIEKNYYREWEELRQILYKYQQKYAGYKIFCFVHNLSYEFDFIIKNLSISDKILSNSSHKVISTILEEFPQIEFRCTLMLSMCSLRKIGKDLGFKKLDSDYRFILPKDTITDTEKEYCCRDCDVCAKYVSTLIKEFGKLRDIPYTKTGRVRKTFNEIYSRYYEKNKPEWDLLPDEDCYTAMCDAFCGGVVMSNPMFTGIVMNNVLSYDITSSYPFVMLSENYPYTIKKIYDIKQSLISNSFWIAKIKFIEIKSKFNWGWLSISKMNDYDVSSCVFFNGKLLYGKEIVRTITSVDFEIISNTYFYEKLEIIEFYNCEKYGELPPPYIETIKIYSKKKYDLKKITKTITDKDKDYNKIMYEYTLSKNDFNSIYGMSVQKLMTPEYEIDEMFNWHEKKEVYIKTDKHLKRNFLYGVFITAYARKNLINAIIANCSDTFIYADTDSIKYFGNNEFVDTNKKLAEKYLSIESLSKLGRFDNDGIYKQFLTYGAKKYAYTIKGSKDVHLTVAGLPKLKSTSKTMKIIHNGKLIKKLNTIKEFTPKTVFLNCKLGKKYITTKYNFELDDDNMVTNISENVEETATYLKENNINTNGGVALFPVNYELDITNNDKIIIKEQKEYLKIWQEKHQNIIHLQEFCDMKYRID